MQLRRAHIKDLPALKALFESTIRESCGQDYSPAEIEGWCASVKNEKRWTDLIAQQYVILFELESEILGFASLKDYHYVDFLYVSQRHQGKGLAQKLIQHLKERALAHGERKLISDFSITAHSIMAKHNWRMIRKNHNRRGEQVLINYRMELLLD